MVQAVMGAGKSVLLSEVCAQAILGVNDCIVVTTSSVKLVEQLHGDLAGRIGGRRVGRYYTHAKETSCQVIVACIDSAERLAALLKEQGRRVALWIADEAHRTESVGIHRAHEAMSPHASLGFTATPYRSRKSEEISLFRTMVFEYSPTDGLADGVILPWRVVPWAGDEVPLDQACVEMISSADGPGVANASSVDDAEAFSAILNASGIVSMPIHSYLDRREQNERLESLRTGRVRCLVHVAMLQEGVDLPWLRWLCLRRNTTSRVRFAQEVGRVLRCYPGKTEGVIFDPLDLFATLKLNYAAVLYGQAAESSSVEFVDIVEGECGWWLTSKDPIEAGFCRGVVARIHRRLRPHPAHDLRVIQTSAKGFKLEGPIPLPLIELVARVAPAATDAILEAAAVASLPIADEVLAVALGDIFRYLRIVTIELEQTGRYSRRVASKTWREGKLYAGMWGKFKSALSAIPSGSHIAEPHRGALRNAIANAHLCSRGPLSDLTDVLNFIAKDERNITLTLNSGTRPRLGPNP